MAQIVIDIPDSHTPELANVLRDAARTCRTRAATSTEPADRYRWFDIGHELFNAARRADPLHTVR